MRGAMLSIDHLAFSIIDVRCYKCYSHPLKTVMIFCWCCRWTDGWCRDRRHCLSGGGWPTGVRIRIYFCFGSAFLNLRAQNRRYLSMVLSAEEKQARVRRLRHGSQSVEWVVHWPSSCSRVCLSLTQKDKMEELCEWCTVLQEASVACGLTFDHVMILAGWFWIFFFFSPEPRLTQTSYCVRLRKVSSTASSTMLLSWMPLDAVVCRYGEQWMFLFFYFNFILL